jgi:hypothetical protein
MKQNTCHLIKLTSYLVPNRISKYCTTEWKYALGNGHWAKPVEKQVAISQIWQRPITSLRGWHASVVSHINKLPVSNSVGTKSDPHSPAEQVIDVKDASYMSGNRPEAAGYQKYPPCSPCRHPRLLSITIHNWHSNGDSATTLGIL